MAGRGRGATLDGLIRSRSKLRGSKYNPVSMVGVRKVVANPMTNSFAVQARFNSLTDPEVPHYDTVIVFHLVQFVRKKDKDHPFEVQITNKDTLYMERPSKGQTICTVTCTCADYFWTWWFFNKNKERAHAWGDLADPSEITGRTTRVTDGRPYGSAPGKIAKDKGIDPRRNPKSVPGVCKHIYNLGMFLSNKGWMAP